MNSKSNLLPTNLQVGRVTPCAPSWGKGTSASARGAYGVRRPTSRTRCGDAYRDFNRGILSVILLLLLSVCSRSNAVPRYREGHLLVKWKDGPDSYAAALGNSVIGSTVKRNFNAIGWQLVELPPGVSVSEGIKAYQALGNVTAVEPDGRTDIQPPPPPASTDPVPRPISLH